MTMKCPMAVPPDDRRDGSGGSRLRPRGEPEWLADDSRADESRVDPRSKQQGRVCGRKAGDATLEGAPAAHFCLDDEAAVRPRSRPRDPAAGPDHVDARRAHRWPDRAGEPRAEAVARPRGGAEGDAVG